MRDAWARRREPRSRRRCSRFENQLPMAARARRGRPVSRSPIASTNPTTKPNGTSHSSRTNEYEVKSTRTRDRARANSSGRSARERSVAGFAVTRPRIGDDEHARAREPGAPAQVEIFRPREGLGIESAEFLEQIGAHEHDRGGDVEDVAHAVVLLLVELARFDAGVRRAETVDGATDLQQDLRVLGTDQLRPEDPGVRPVGLFHQQPNGRWVEHHVVVAQQEQGGPFDRVQGLVRRHREAGAAVETAHERPRQHRRDAVGRVVVGAAVDHEDGEVVVVLPGEPVEGVLEPGSGIAGDHHRHHRRVLRQRFVGGLVVVGGG